MVMIMLFYINILRYCIQMYNICSLNELRELLILKAISFNYEIKRKSIIFYYDDEMLYVDYIVNIVDGKIVMTNKIIDQPQLYLCIDNNAKVNVIDIILFYIISLLSLAFLFINLKIAFTVLVGLVKVKLNIVQLLNILFAILILNIILFNNYLVLISILLIIFSYKINDLIYISFIPLFMVNTYIGNGLALFYICLLIYYKLTQNQLSNNLDMRMLKLLIRKPISKIESLKINDVVIEEFGIYFFEINQGSTILINDINLKFIAVESLSKILTIVYVVNENSFFTNRQKYSKIDSVGKYVIYLYERK